MGTRGTIAVRVNGEVKGAYNHFDSYYSGLGEEVLAFAKTLKNPNVRAEWKQLAEQLRPIPEGSKPTEEDIERLKGFTDLSVSTRSTEDWYCLLRGAQGSLPKTLKAGLYEPFPVGEEEYSYVIDFDAGQFEVYDGRDMKGSFPFTELPDSLREIATYTSEDGHYYS